MSRTTAFAFFALMVLVSGTPKRFVDHEDAERAVAARHSTAAPVPSTPIFVGSHNYAYIVLQDGCYSIQLSSQQIHALRSSHDSEVMKAKLLEMVEQAVERHEIDHHTIDRERSSIQTHCADLPIFRFLLTDHHH